MCEGLVIKCHFLRHQHKLKADPFQLSVRACFSSSGAGFTEACWEPAAGIQLRTSVVSIHSLPTPRAPCKPGSERQRESDPLALLCCEDWIQEDRGTREGPGGLRERRASAGACLEGLAGVMPSRGGRRHF